MNAEARRRQRVLIRFLNNLCVLCVSAFLAFNSRAGRLSDILKRLCFSGGVVVLH